MTLNTLTNTQTVYGNGATTVFSCSFTPDSAEDIQVVYTNASGQQTTLAPTSYLIAINPVPVGELWADGFTVTYPISGQPIANGTSLTISRILPLTQETDLGNGSNFYPNVIEQGLDTLEMQVQQTASRTGLLRGTWISGVQYNYSDMVVDGANGADTNNIYSCVSPNISGVWATDLANGLWTLVLNVQGIVNSLPQIGNNQLFGNISGVTTTPVGVGASAFLDSAFGNSQGSILYRDISLWETLAPGTSGYYLKTQGPSSNPVWGAVTGSGTITGVTAGTGLTGGGSSGNVTLSFATVANNSILANVTGSTAAPGATTLSALLDAIVGNTLGTTLYRKGTVWGAFTYLWQDTTNLNTAVGFTGAPATISQSGGGGNGTQNTTFGHLALNVNTTGQKNTAVGYGALVVNTTGVENTAIGANAGSSLVSGAGNTAVGEAAFMSLTTGNYNVAIGDGAGIAGTAITTGSSNTMLGYQTGANSAAASNRTAIGYQAASLSDNDITLGNSSISTIHAEVTSITAISDGRRKKDITSLNLGLDFISKLNPVSFTKTNGDNTLRFGLIAQELMEALPEDLREKAEVSDPKAMFALIERGSDEDRTFGVSYGELIAPMIKAMQEMKAEIDILKQQVTT